MATNGKADPTANVIALNDAAITRQDDLRELTNELMDEKIKRMEVTAILRDQIANLRAEHSKEIRVLESDRLDKIRQVDVLAGNTAADRALVAIQTLDRTTQANAETLRSMVANTATTIATQTANTVAQQNERIAALEKSSYTGIGKSALSDPQMERLSKLVEDLARAQASGTGKSAGLSLSAAILMGAISVIGGLMGIAGVLYAVLKH